MPLDEREDASLRGAVVWTGNQGEGTASYHAYARDHEVTADGTPSIPGSSDPTFSAATPGAGTPSSSWWRR